MEPYAYTHVDPYLYVQPDYYLRQWELRREGGVLYANTIANRRGTAEFYPEDLIEHAIGVVAERYPELMEKIATKTKEES